jgi:hypothetical protein
MSETASGTSGTSGKQNTVQDFHTFIEYLRGIPRGMDV